MSQASRHQPTFSRRVDSLPKNGDLGREGSRAQRRRPVGGREAYLFALRVAFLVYLLQPRQKRKEHVPGPPKPIQRTTSVMQDVMKEWGSISGTSKGTRLPRDFMKRLLERMQRVLVGTEPRQEYKDSLIRRSFAASLNYFMEAGFQKRMEKDRKPDDLVLMFYSRATAELQKGKAQGDDSWKMMVDRHVALFVRLMSLIMKDNGWVAERPELVQRFQTLETKLLKHDQDLAEDTSNGTMVEVVVPLSYHVKDMHLVQIVSRIFETPIEEVQTDIDHHKDEWTLKAALQDIKTYQTLLSLNSRHTLTSDDFDLESAYETWKKGEAPELSQMIYSIIQIEPELAKHVNTPRHGPSGSIEINSAAAGAGSFQQDSNYSQHHGDPSGMSIISPTTDRPSTGFDESDHTFTFLPSDRRAYYRAIVATVIRHQLRESQKQLEEGAEPPPESSKLFSKEGTELLNEICKIWRIPYASRVVLFLDVVREMFLEGETDVETLDQAFMCLKDGIPEAHHKEHAHATEMLFDRNQWPLADFSLIQQVLTAIHEALLRDLYTAAMSAYDSKPPGDLGPLMYVLDTYVYEDPSFTRGTDDLQAFTEQLQTGLKDKASQMYRDLFSKHMPQDQDTWEFYNIIQLGKGVITLAQKIQKRYRKNPEILGANPLSVLVEVMLPEYAMDARDVVAHILELAKYRGEEVPIEDGFDLYQELVDIRRIHNDSVPGVDFAFEIEDLLADFVWRWIKLTGDTMTEWIEGAVKQDEFKVRSEGDGIPSEEERHSVSVLDIFSSFNQAIEKIVGLNWDNDLHYAKFMTAIAKIVGSGLSRYCEILEQKFTREMDRLTPEQEVASNRTRQEKWMQVAKDVWTNKEKVEPFQFFPESFVKLNNIDYATRQLDRLEKEVNVDACADVIQKNTPPQVLRQQRKAASYVFTIKIVEAEDLKACDMTGLSDPYVVLGDEYQKRLAKTRIIYQNLNPRWDESVDITTQGPINVVATVWDWDQLGEHDCVGRTSIKLDPAHFGDFVPREYWLDLDTQGRLLLRVSMEGERDDIQFYFGKAFRTLKRTERDMTRIITDKLSSYINYCLSRRALKSLLNKGINLSTVTSYFNRNRPPPTSTMPSAAEIADALKGLFTYFDDNFAIMNQTLTNNAMITVMTRLWKEVLATIEALVVPPLSDKPSQQRQLNEQELEVVFKWLKLLFDFFHAVDEETGEAAGVPLDVLRSPKYFDLTSLNFFYFEPTDALIRESERMASATAARQQQQARNRLSAPAGLGVGGAQSLLAARARKTKSILLSRNLGTMRKAKEEKRKEAQADPNDDMILRILRMRPEAEKYLKDRSRQKERLAAAAAAELIVKQSLAAGGGRMTGSLPRR